MRSICEYKSVAAAARDRDMSASTIYGRLWRGWSDWKALNEPPGSHPYRGCSNWGIYHEAWLKKQVRAKELRAMGMSYDEIATGLGCSRSKVCDLLKRETPAYS